VAPSGFTATGSASSNQSRHNRNRSFTDVVLLKNTVTQMVYKHAISTIVPARAVNINYDAAE